MTLDPRQLDCSLYSAPVLQEVCETSKESLPDNDGSGNEADSESEAEVPAIFVSEPVIACFNNPQCNPLSEDEGE